ncbi:hypothetical protein [Ruegeria atlantica]|uniref:hypothetical protein n=1 Tax=Ruegeria atlantica TaxID=81569 RepID=UPI00147EC976|nr:hypothetical protein [Ruegeria atlantica]
MKFSDETLLEYLEGKLDESGANAIESAVETDPDLELRLMALDPYAPAVQAVFDRLSAETPQIDLPESVAPAQPVFGGLRLLAVAASVAIIAVSATFWTTRPEPLGWAEQAAIYQSLYVPKTIASLDNSPELLDAQFSLAEEQLGHALNRDALAALPGMELKRAQVLSFEGKPLIQVVFADAQGRPFAFCIIRQGGDAPNMDVEQEILSGLATATWSQDGFGYMLIGSSDQIDLSRQLEFLTASFAS